ncbi:MAG: phenylacetic acid degradation operon negative regulatory protein PaaX, partial [Gammaproteobacteria bacterium]|nr:phenylacetic acid degradation operon negative regulatory protein PaaX [Gammaproteobacteria bacterium]
LGFGLLGNGLWISPHRVQGEVNEVAGELGVADHIEIFRAEYRGYSSAAHLVGRCWNLPEIERRYMDFLARHGPAFERLSRGGERSLPEEAYVRRFWLVHEYRVFPLLDPYLPRELLPADWHGEAAAVLFDAYHDLLTAPAEQYVDSVLEVYEGAAQAVSAHGA